MKEKELVEYIAKSLVEKPEAVAVKEIRGSNVTVLELHVAREDMGRVIGKDGRVANALRILLRVATRDEKRVVLEILTGIQRAGATIILTYHAKDVVRWLEGC